MTAIAPTADPAPPLATDPATRSPAQWSARLAALTGQGRTADDPDMAECRAALAYWRVRRVHDAERDALDPAHIPALADLLRHAHPVLAVTL